MAYLIPQPNISSASPTQKVEQMQNYLFTLSENLNWILNTIDRKAENGSDLRSVSGGGIAVTQQEAETVFNAIKSLIMQSSEVIESFYKNLKDRYDEDYASVTAYEEFVNRYFDLLTYTLKHISDLADGLADALNGTSKEPHQLNFGKIQADISDGLAIKWTGGET